MMISIVHGYIFFIGLVYSHPYYHDLVKLNKGKEVYLFETEYDNNPEFNGDFESNDTTGWLFPELDSPTHTFSETYERWESFDFTPPAFHNWGITKERYGHQNIVIISDPTDSNTTVLKVIYPKGSRNPSHSPLGGAGYESTPISILDGIRQTARLSYQVYFPEEFNFTQGNGIVVGGKLPGLYGASAECSGGNSAQNCFSARFMWREEGLGEIYLYVPKMAHHLPSLCQVPPVSVCDPKYGFSLGRGSFRFKRGAWNKLSVAVRVNQVPDEPTGQLRVWYDDEVVIDYNQLIWRVNDTVGYTGIDFETFFGGSSDRFNTPIDTYTLYKDFRLVVGQNVEQIESTSGEVASTSE
ncbi:hypothetical protein K7432_005996 [Basidiobolus ranarum]|uniref:Polysaccharide lyase 14 domain-containing protein n=1 Tax=Basidiobolus ranarum TaxID=34480 RepID=A0ABR2WVR1_9FUNG